jgi:hypothetical protein
MVYRSAVELTGLNLGFWVGRRFHRPGTWRMVLIIARLAWGQQGDVQVALQRDG